MIGQLVYYEEIWKQEKNKINSTQYFITKYYHDYQEDTSTCSMRLTNLFLRTDLEAEISFAVDQSC